MSDSPRSKNAATKKLLENLESDLRNLSAEAKRKHPQVREAAEGAHLKVRTIASRKEDVISGLMKCSKDLILPVIVGCESKNPKLVQICLMYIQRLIAHETVTTKSAGIVIDSLWGLMEAGLEELKLLQTAILLITTNVVVQHDSLAKALVLCFRLHFTKDSTTTNTAAAIIKQLINVIFERVVAEDSNPCTGLTESISLDSLKTCSKEAPKSLLPCAADAYLLFQDLCQLVNADQPHWLIGMTEMTRTFGLELLESILTSFSTTFTQHKEFSFLLKERVCPLVIKLFSPSLKYRHGLPALPSPTPVEKPFFPIVVRLMRIVSILIQNYYSLLITECEIFLSLLVKFLDPEKPIWQRCLTLEVIHRLSQQPTLLRSFCQSYDMKPHSTKIFRDFVNAIGAFIQSQFMAPLHSQTNVQGSKSSDLQSSSQSLISGVPAGGGITPQPAFIYRGAWIPLNMNVAQSGNKFVYLELLDKIEAPHIPDGYGMSVAFYTLLDIVRSLQMIIGTDTHEPGGSFVTKELEEEERLLRIELINSSWCGVLAALSLLLDASTEESATEQILKTDQVFVNLCGKLKLNTPRDAFITALCKSSLPPHYALTVLNSANKSHVRSLGMEGESEAIERSQVVVVGTALATASLPMGAHQGPVMLTAKNIQCMRTLLSVAHCHGSILGSAWHLVLTTLQHLVWILGLKPSAGGGLKAGKQLNDSTNAVVTSALMADLPILSSMLSRLFESSQYLDDVALHHLIDALCKLSSESMDLAYSNREPSLFAVAKLLETGLVNLKRVTVLWRPVTAHLLEVCQHPQVGMRTWGAEALTTLTRDALQHKFSQPLNEDLKLQSLLLAPLETLSSIHHADIRQKQLDCILQVLHNNGDTLEHGWPVVLGVIGAITDQHSEGLIRLAFQSLQLVVQDFLPIIPCEYLRICVEVASAFGLQTQELNVSLTAIGLLWNISDFFYQNAERIQIDMNSREKTTVEEVVPFDSLWMSLFSQLGQLCVDERPAVRKSAGQTLFSTISAHGSLLQKGTWKQVLWKVLFPLLEKVLQLSSTASATRDEAITGNILIHHSRDTAQKQWAETRVLSLAGVARTFNSKRSLLQPIGDFPRAWSLLLEHIESSALCPNVEVSLAALKSFQEILQFSKTDDRSGRLISPPVSETMSRQTTADHDISISLWVNAWRVWVNIGANATKPPDNKSHEKVYVPSQAFLTTLVHTFPPLFEHIKPRFTHAELGKLFEVLTLSLAVPVHGEASPFILPTYPEVVITPLQEAVLHAVNTLMQAVQNGHDHLSDMFPDVFRQLLSFVTYLIHPPKYGSIETKSVSTPKSAQSDWVTMNFVPFAERSVEVICELYAKCASHPSVISAAILTSIIKTFHVPLNLKYNCTSPHSWIHLIKHLITILHTGLPVARKHGPAFSSLWPELASTFEDFLFSTQPTPATLSVEDCQRDETIDCQVIQLMRDDILPHSASMPRDFLLSIMSILNRGSIHSATPASFIDTDSSRKLREEFAKSCFETLLQFSFTTKSTEEGSLTKMAVMSLLKRCQEVVKKYVEDEKLSGKCPLPRPRLVEMTAVLKAITTLLSSLKQAPVHTVEKSVWVQVISLYSCLVDCTTSGSPQVCKALRDVLYEYRDLLSPPTSHVHNGVSTETRA